jgi:uncharacterized membrane protein
MNLESRCRFAATVAGERCPRVQSETTELSRSGASIFGVSNRAGNEHAVPDAHVHDGDSEARPNDPDEVISAKEKRLRLLFTFPILLGLFICALNLLAVIRVWRTVYLSNLGLLSWANLPNTVFLTLVTISTFIGLALIGYAIALRQLDGYSSRDSEIPNETAAVQELRRVSYVKWMMIPLLVAIPAPALTVWAADVVQPISPRPCIEIYQDALKIKKDSPDFTMPWNDRDELRCSVNRVLK